MFETVNLYVAGRDVPLGVPYTVPSVLFRFSPEGRAGTTELEMMGSLESSTMLKAI